MRPTANRNVKVEFGYQPRAIIQPYFSYDRQYTDINAAKGEKLDGLHVLAGIGYQLRAFSYDDSTLFESQSRQPTTLTSTIAPGHTSKNHNQPPGLTGVTSPDLAAPSMPLLQKQVEAGGTWDKRLSADQTSFPGPALTNYDLDRVMVGADVHDPQDKILFSYSIPGSKLTMIGIVARVYFNGPAGHDDVLEGDGIYCLAVRGDGALELFERGGTTWKLRAKFQYQAPTWASYNQVIIATNASISCEGTWRGNTISISVKSFDDGSGSRNLAVGMLMNKLNAIAINAVNSVERPSAFVYKAPRDTMRPVQQVANRLDVRRDTRVKFGLFKPKYPTTGFIEDEPIGLPGIWTPGTFTFEWYGDRPTGTAIEAKVYNAGTGDEFTGTVILDDCLGQQIQFEIPDGTTVGHLRVRFEFEGDGTNTPTLTSYRILRDGVVQTDPLPVNLTLPIRAAGAALPSAYTLGVDATGPGDDPAQESASLEVIDLFGEAADLRTKGGTPVEISVVDDSDTLISYLHRGLLRENESQRLSKKEGFTNSRRYSLTISGEHDELSRAIAKNRILLVDKSYIGDTDNAAPMKATAAIKLLFKAAGYSDAQLDIPDLPIRLWGEDQQVVEVSTRLIEPIRQIVDEYLGGHLIFDRNAGDDGMWRVIPRRHAADYRFLARFTPDHPGAGRMIVPSTAYGTHDYGTHEVPVLPMFGPVRERLEPAEANFVSVNGGSFDPAVSGLSSPARNMSWAANFNSVNLLNLPDGHAFAPDPTSRDYLGKYVDIDVWDMSLQSQAAADWIARRVFDTACYARQYKTFTSWLEFVTDSEDTYQTTARPLRFYDMVEVYEWESDTWVPYVVVKCSPRFRKSGVMTADYTLMTSTAFASFAVATSPMSVYRMETKGRRIQNRVSSGMPSHMHVALAPNKALIGPGLGSVSLLPSPVSETLQYIDPDESNFGQFKPMAGYDPSA